jgi:WD40 repeat protein
MAVSSSGDLIFAAYTDNSMQLIDIRMNTKVRQFKTGGHKDLVKALLVSQDESVVYSGGSDGTLRIWDIGSEQVI